MKPDTCVCFACPNMKDIRVGQDYDCGCDTAPIWDEEACSECYHKDYCDVAINPHLYSTK